MTETLLGGVGYHDLRDFSVGPWMVERLREEEWPAWVTLADQSRGPIDECHRLDAADPPFGRWVVIGAARRGRAPGSVSAYRWDGDLPDVEEIQARVAEAVTGVVALDNLVLVAGALGAAPPEVYVVEVEPEVEEMGEELSPAVAEAAREAMARARSLALAPAGGAPVERAPLGGPR